MRRWIRALAHRLGIELTRYTPTNYTHLRRAEILRSGSIDIVLDVGAHDGSWAREALATGFTGQIESFEPRTDSYALLERRAAAEQRWGVHRLALSDHDGFEVLHVSGHPQSSSLLALDVQGRIDPRFAYVASEKVETATLDGLAIVDSGGAAYLKVDVQGHELAVLRGAATTVERSCRVVELELSFVPLYADQALAHDLMAWMWARGFRLSSIEATWRDPAHGDLLAANGIFTRF